MAFGIDDAVVAGLPVLGNLLGGLFGGDQKAQQQQLLNQQIQDLQNQGVPSVQAQQIALQKMQENGTYTPGLEQTISQGNTELNNVNSNPQDMQAQTAALQSLQQIGQQGGMTLQDKANLNALMNSTAQANAGQQGAIQNQAAERGIQNSGLQLAQQLAAAQGANQQNNQNALTVAGQAQARALQALQGAGSLGQSMEAQQYGEAANKANAQDIINKFNAQNAQQVAGANTQAQNAGQQYNLNRGDIYNQQNTGIANQQEVYNKGLQQQNYEDQMQKLGALGQARGAAAGVAGQNAQQTAQMFGNIGSGLSGIYGAANGMQPKQKTPVQPGGSM